MSIRWDKFEPRKHEDMVSVLLSRLHPDAQRIDGKGGDGGRDVQIVSRGDGHIMHAFELKSFTGRMTRSRRKQVERSLKRAAALGPLQWTLVVPIDPTPAEEKWFRQLETDYCFPLEWRGKTWLDEKMAAFPDIRRYFVEGANDEVVRLLLELQKEQAMVTDVHDAVARLRTLHERLNEIDPHYRYQMATVTVGANCWPTDVVFSVKFGDVRVDVYPKYAGAIEDRPISIKVMVAMGLDYPSIQEALGYGLETSIPDNMISSVTIDAPLGLGGTFCRGELHISSTVTMLEEPVRLALFIMDGPRAVVSRTVQLTEMTGGPKGSIFTGTDDTGWLQIRLTISVVDEEGKVEFRLNPKPTMPTALLPLFRWVDAYRPPNSLKIRWPEGFEIQSEVDGPFLLDGSLGRYVEALAYLQESTGIYWEMPLSLSKEEAQEIVTAAALLKGESIDLKWNSFNLNMHRWGPELQELEDGGAKAFLFYDDISLVLHGERIPIGRVRTHFPSARLADPESVQQALASGLVPSLRLVPGDNDQAQRVLVTEPR